MTTHEAGRRYAERLDVKFAPGFRNAVWREEPDGTQTMISGDMVEISLVSEDAPPFVIHDD